MGEAINVASFRRVTPGIVASARLAMANDVPDTSKAEISLLLKRAAPVLGIDGTTYHVMDILLGLSRADDWKGAGRPVVAISNAKLAEYTMRSERTVIRCIRRLVEVGVAAYRDSSTGRRFVYRSDKGELISGYGIDFTPARVRSDELRDAVEHYRARLNEETAAKRDVARLSRAIEDLCIAFPEVGPGYREEMQNHLSSLAPMTDKANALRSLHARAIAALSAEDESPDMSGEGDISVSPIINTTLESLSGSKQKRTRSIEREQTLTISGKAAEIAYENKPADVEPAWQPRSGLDDDRTPEVIQSEVLASVSIGLLHAACREAQSMTGVVFDSWSALARSGEVLRRMIGLSEAGWADGHQKIGLHAASAILATVVEKSIRDPDQISKPGGYFRAMVDRAIGGQLNLERSLFGLADQGYGG
jgi:replication initiation protein RepC